MIARIKFDYVAREKLRGYGVQNDASIMAKLCTAIVNAPLADADDWTRQYGWPDETLIDLEEDAPTLVELGINFTIVAFKGTRPLTAILPQTRTPVTVHVQIPHVGLLAMNEVKVVEDYCTDRLQGELDAGWRILCVCPPNAARRPDYILGRYDSDRENRR